MTYSTSSRERCMRRYQQLDEDSLARGLSEPHVGLSRAKYAVPHGQRTYLVPTAYSPTGIALGHLLPDRVLLGTFWNASLAAEAFLRRGQPQGGPWFAHVPAEAYHVTVVNYRHFETTAELSSVVSLDRPTQERVEAIVRATVEAPIIIDVDGYTLTEEGRLFVRGFPRDERLEQLRDDIVAMLPNLNENRPRTAHIKLGHVLIPAKPEIVKSLMAKLNLTIPVQGTLVFHDVFTPLGRIPFYNRASGLDSRRLEP